jgi:hypothetical protein
VQPEPVIYRDEAVAMLFIIRLIEGDDGEEAPPEDIA